MDETDVSKKSILDDLGQEAAGIAAPVSLCMLLTVLLVRILNPKEGNQQFVGLATAFYHEKARAHALSPSCLNRRPNCLMACHILFVLYDRHNGSFVGAG